MNFSRKSFIELQQAIPPERWTTQKEKVLESLKNNFSSYDFATAFDIMIDLDPEFASARLAGVHHSASVVKAIQDVLDRNPDFAKNQYLHDYLRRCFKMDHSTTFKHAAGIADSLILSTLDKDPSLIDSVGFFLSFFPSFFFSFPFLSFPFLSFFHFLLSFTILVAAIYS